MQINPENKVLVAISTFFDIVWLTILWIVVCIPVVTAGASTTAYMATLLALAEGRGSSVTVGFFRRLKENFGIATKLWLVMLLIGVILIWDLVACFVMKEPEILRAVLCCTTVAFSLCYGAVMEYLFAGLGRFVAEPRQTIRNAAGWAMGHWKTTLLLLILDVAAVCTVPFLTVLAVIPVSVLKYAQAKLLSRVFRPYEEQMGSDRVTAEVDGNA